VNGSEQEGINGVRLVDQFAGFAKDSTKCTAAAGATSTGTTTGTACNAWGETAVSAWLDQAFVADNTTPAGTNFMPGYSAEASGGYNTALTSSVFGVGNGMPSIWISKLKQNAADSLSPLAHGSARTHWVDMIIINYAASNDYAQNFRLGLTFGNDWNKETGEIVRAGACAGGGNQDPNSTYNAEENCNALIDQRLEQGDQNMGADDAGYAFQQAFGAISGPNFTQTTGGQETNGTSWFNEGAVADNGRAIGQNVEQATEGFFYSCLNCGVGDGHAFTPPDKLTYQTWPTRPKITQIKHADAAFQTTWVP
jgi:hypothetical protein